MLQDALVGLAMTNTVFLSSKVIATVSELVPRAKVRQIPLDIAVRSAANEGKRAQKVSIRYTKHSHRLALTSPVSSRDRCRCTTSCHSATLPAAGVGGVEQSDGADGGRKVQTVWMGFQ